MKQNILLVLAIVLVHKNFNLAIVLVQLQAAILVFGMQVMFDLIFV